MKQVDNIAGFLFTLSIFNVDLDNRKRDNTDVIYPEIGYSHLGRVIDNLELPEKKSKGSRMPFCWSDP